jgi:hypothetical protein
LRANRDGKLLSFAIQTGKHATPTGFHATWGLAKHSVVGEWEGLHSLGKGASSFARGREAGFDFLNSRMLEARAKHLPQQEAQRHLAEAEARQTARQMGRLAGESHSGAGHGETAKLHPDGLKNKPEGVRELEGRAQQLAGSASAKPRNYVRENLATDLQSLYSDSGAYGGNKRNQLLEIESGYAGRKSTVSDVVAVANRELGYLKDYLTGVKRGGKLDPTIRDLRAMSNYKASLHQQRVAELHRALQPSDPIGTLSVTSHLPDIPDPHIPGGFIPDPRVARTQEAADFLAGITSQKVGLSVSGVDLATTSSRRAYYNGNAHNNTVHLHPDNLVDVAAHEIGHALEQKSPYIHGHSSQYYNQRTHGQPLTPLGVGFDAHEQYRPGFVDNYMGKDYGVSGGRRPPTEIISMGVQELYLDPIALIKKDPQLFDFLIEVLHGERK